MSTSNPVNNGNPQPAPSPIEQALTLLDQVVAIVGPAPALTTTDRKRSSRMRKGGETVIPTVATLSDQFGIVVTSFPTADMLANRTKAQALIPLQQKLVMLLKNVQDQTFQANSDAWKAASMRYSMLRRFSRTDGTLQTALSEIKGFFARKSTSSKTAKQPAPAGQTAATEQVAKVSASSSSSGNAAVAKQ